MTAVVFRTACIGGVCRTSLSHLGGDVVVLECHRWYHIVASLLPSQCCCDLLTCPDGSAGLTAKARSDVDKFFGPCPDCKGLVPLLPQIYKGIPMEVDGGVVVAGACA
jgi:hypothetical protein